MKNLQVHKAVPEQWQFLWKLTRMSQPLQTMGCMPDALVLSLLWIAVGASDAVVPLPVAYPCQGFEHAASLCAAEHQV